MLSSLLSGRFDLIVFLFRIPCILIALTCHEVAHGWMAMKLGDHTAEVTGRLSLNPLRHLDPIGTICMLFFGFGWAKPVMVNARNFEKPKRDMALTAFAGPVMNLILCFIGLLIFRILCAVFGVVGAAENSVLNNAQFFSLYFFEIFVSLNVSLAVFNLIPIPPLDGSRLLFVFLPPKLYFGFMKYERYIMFAFLILLYLGILNLPLSALCDLILTGFDFVIGLIPFL